MRCILLLTALYGLTALVAILVGLLARAYVLDSQRQYVWPEKRITLDLEHPDELRNHVGEWISGVGKDELCGSVEREPVILVIRRNDAVYALESTGVRVYIDLARCGKVVKVFIATPGMTVNETVLFTTHFLAMLNARPDKLNQWAKCEKGPTQGCLEIFRTEDREYALEVRSYDQSRNLWWIAIDINRRSLDYASEE